MTIARGPAVTLHYERYLPLPIILDLGQVQGLCVLLFHFCAVSMLRKSGTVTPRHCVDRHQGEVERARMGGRTR